MAAPLNRYNDGFEFSSRNGMKLSECVVVGVRSESAVSDSLDGFLIDSGLEECLPDDPGVEATAFDSRDRDLREEIKR
ncbi:hypothetical protein C488_17144 [Natrinema pellirubrum DSM 15624]|uniref:Uncharacterized protein n=1 Tax=Natrinema pellirubrum (strain DSM 15624 / CIP 106293 / JCM 10476 / NCIMB 786 / 157) TaxID=797303 RepID=L9YFF4_NATP1|nr:hypothetical protein C488_17144 [Natrinema pellirubrum DSM 15624]